MTKKKRSSVPVVTAGPATKVKEMFGDKAITIECFMNIMWRDFNEGTEEFEFSFKFTPRGKDRHKYNCRIMFNRQMGKL